MKDTLEKQRGYYLLHLDVAKKKVSSRFLGESLSVTALAEYKRLEDQVFEDRTQDVVLVGANSREELELAYSNYFADNISFLGYLGEITGT